MSDVVLFSTVEGGEITCEAGQIALDDGVETAVYISLFGANEDDSGDDDGKSVEWWGNKVESDSTKKLRSRTQYLLRSIALTSASLLLIEDAVAQDLQWMLDTKLADAVVPSASIPALNTVKIDVKIEIQDKTFTPSFVKKTGTAS
jgi:phage gp46-like protein